MNIQICAAQFSLNNKTHNSNNSGEKTAVKKASDHSYENMFTHSHVD